MFVQLYFIVQGLSGLAIEYEHEHEREHGQKGGDFLVVFLG